MNNPYTSRGPLKNTRMFFGRQRELNEIALFLRGNQSVSIVGPRKIGKTSLMLHLMRHETRADLPIGPENLLVYLDCEALSGSTLEEVYARFCTEIAVSLWDHDLEPEPALKAAATALNRLAFEEALRRLNQRGLRVVLMLDEFEQLTVNPNLNVSFFNSLRSAAGRLRLVFLTASADPLIELTFLNRDQNILSSPFFNVFTPLFLGPLPEIDARKLIRGPMEAAGLVADLPQLEDFIYRLTGGHPHALQIACFHAWEQPDNLDRIETRTMQELEAHFKYEWHQLSPAEREALTDLSQAGSRASENPALRVVLRNLVRRGLLVQAGETYDYPSRAWADFVTVRLADPEPPLTDTDPAVRMTVAAEESTTSQPQGSRGNIALADSRENRKSAMKELLKASAPEAIGGLAAQAIYAILAGLILGLVGLIRYFEDVVRTLRSVYAAVGPVWLILVALGVLAGGILVVRAVLRRKRSP